MRPVFILGLLALHALSANAQDFLVLSRPGIKKNIKYYEGDEIIIKVKGSNHFQPQVIRDLKPDSVLFYGNFVHPDSIEVVDIRAINKPHKLGAASIIAGIGYLLVDQFNHTVVKARGWEVNETVLGTSAMLVGAGILIKKTKRRFFKVNKNNKIKVVTF